MTRHFILRNGCLLHADYRAGTDARPIVFANSLGTDLRLWDAVVSRLPPAHAVLRLDKRGHGLSDVATTCIAELADDLAAVMDRFDLSGALICGVSVGGLIAQSLTRQRPDLVGGLVLSNTGTRIGNADMWNPRIEAVRQNGIVSIADAVMQRWFAPQFLADNPALVAGYRNMLTRTPDAGYAAICAAIRDADLTGDAASLNVPALCIAGDADQSTPPEVVAQLATALPRAKMVLLDDVGHLPCAETPDRVADLILRMEQSL